MIWLFYFFGLSSVIATCLEFELDRRSLNVGELWFDRSSKAECGMNYSLKFFSTDKKETVQSGDITVKYCVHTLINKNDLSLRVNSRLFFLLHCTEGEIVYNNA